jgi:hypothetical protein
LPLDDVLIGNAEAVWALLIGFLRLLSAAYTYCISRRNFFGGKQLWAL